MLRPFSFFCIADSTAVSERQNDQTKRPKASVVASSMQTFVCDFLKWVVNSTRSNLFGVLVCFADRYHHQKAKSEVREKLWTWAQNHDTATFSDALRDDTVACEAFISLFSFFNNQHLQFGPVCVCSLHRL